MLYCNFCVYFIVTEVKKMKLYTEYKRNVDTWQIMPMGMKSQANIYSRPWYIDVAWTISGLANICSRPWHINVVWTISYLATYSSQTKTRHSENLAPTLRDSVYPIAVLVNKKKNVHHFVLQVQEFNYTTNLHSVHDTTSSTTDPVSHKILRHTLAHT